MASNSYSRQAREIVNNVLEYFQRMEIESGEGIIVKRTPVQHTEMATGVGRTTIFKIKKDGPISPEKRGRKRLTLDDKIDNFDRGVLRRMEIGRASV